MNFKSKGSGVNSDTDFDYQDSEDEEAKNQNIVKKKSRRWRKRRFIKKGVTNFIFTFLVCCTRSLKYCLTVKLEQKEPKEINVQTAR